MLARFKKAVAVFLRELRAEEQEDKKFYCPCCDSWVKDFNMIDRDYLGLVDKYQVVHSPFLFETFNFLKYECPKCYSSDRDRLYAMYFRQRFKNIGNQKLKFIDFAPNAGVSVFLKQNEKLNYRSADLYMEGVDDRVDISDMKLYKDESVDMFLCSHVLEHVPNDVQAMKELYRILKKGGSGIAMVPIYTGMETVLEDDNIVSAEDRWKYYGQDDHVRLYSKQGFVERLKIAGFDVKELGIEYFGKDNFDVSGIHPRSILYVVEKTKH